MLGKVIETSFIGGWIRTEYESKVRKVSLDDYHQRLPITKGDQILLCEGGKLLVLIPTDQDIIEAKVLGSLSAIPQLFGKIILQSSSRYISRNDFQPTINKDHKLSAFFNVMAWKDYYYKERGVRFRELLGNTVPLPECVKFLKFWLKEHLFRQFELLGFSVEETNLLIEELSISSIGSKVTIEDVLLVLSTAPGRFMYVHPDIPESKLRHLEILYDCQKIPEDILRLKKRLSRHSSDTYLDFDSKAAKAFGKNIALFGKYGLYAYDNRIALMGTYKLESFVSKVIQAKISASDYSWQDRAFKFLGDHVGLSEDQLSGIKMVFNSQISIITGGPGTGKTKLIHGIIKEAISRNIKYHVAAFTGKAVGRVKETAHPETIESSTIDMMFVRGSEHYQFSLLILEEASMITTRYIYRLFQTFNPLRYRIVLVGDMNQIPPLEKGQFFTSLLWSKRVPYIRLEKNFRVDQKYGGDIVTNAARIVDPLRSYKKAIDLDTESPSFNINIGNLDFLKSILTSLGTSGVDSLTILAPYNVVVDKINKIFQSIKYNSKDDFLITSKGTKWYIGDRIMVTENQVSSNLANGDLGTIIEIGGGSIVFTLDKSESEEVTYTFTPADADKKLKHSYCFTINKSQGSEYNTVILYLPVNESNDFFLNLNMIYTAITRAKKLVYIIVEDLNILINACNTALPIPKDNLSYEIVKRFPDKEYQGSLVKHIEESDGEYSDFDYDF